MRRMGRGYKVLITLLSFTLGGCGHLLSVWGIGEKAEPSQAAAKPVQRPSIVYHPRDLKPERDDTGEDSIGHDDLWPRLREGLTLHHISHADVRDEIAWFERNNDFLLRSFARGEPYLHLIVEEVERRGMPSDIALLPVVESAFQPLAYSPGKASGIWQFIPATGLRFGLAQNALYDGRRDIVASTRAAMDYLQALHKRFDGDWLHAIAAYNCGERNVERAIAKNRAEGKPTDFWSLSLPKETSAYVPRLIAVSTIVANPSAHQLTLEPIPNRPYAAMVDVHRPIDVIKAGEIAGIDQEEMKALNPGFKRGITGRGSYTLLVPVAKTERFRLALSELPDADMKVAMQELTPEEPFPRRHKVQQGETLGGLAKRYKVTVAELQRVNRLTGHQIRAGRQLIIPAKAARPDTRVAAAPAQATAKSTARTSPRYEDGKVVHTVQRGDTLWHVSRRYQVSVDNLSAWNGIPPSATLNLGQQIVIWTSSSNYTPPGVTKTAAIDASATEAVPYEVRSGDSLWTIARRFDVTVSDLMQWNGLDKRAKLQPGQRLTIHVDPNTVRI